MRPETSMLGEIQAEDMGMKGRSERICGQDGSRERAVGEGGPGQWGGGQVRVDLHIPGFVGLFKSPLIFFSCPLAPFYPLLHSCSLSPPKATLYCVQGTNVLH